MNNQAIREYLVFVNELKESGILLMLAGLIKAETERTGETALQVLDRSFKIEPKVIKLKLIAAFQAAGFSWEESNNTVNELFRRLAKPSYRESEDDLHMGAGRSLPECDLLDSECDRLLNGGKNE